MIGRGRQRQRALRSPAAADEAFRVLRSNVLVAIETLENPVIVITSAHKGEGKTTTCAGLARSLAVAGVRVVAADLDLRSPDLHRHLGGHDDLGVSDVLLDRKPLAECLEWIPVPGGASDTEGLYLLSSGATVPNPTELLTTGRTQRMLRSLSEQADVVLIDTAPVLAVADTLVVGRNAAGAILVVAAESTEVTDANRAKDALARNQTRLLGLVVNRAKDGGDTLPRYE
jgi:capsular exopolysaccharide synthesis family protein